MPTYRYVFNTYCCRPDSKLEECRLIGGNNVAITNSAIRILIPDNVKIDKPCDGWSYCDSTMTLGECSPAYMVRKNNRLVVSKTLTKAWLDHEIDHEEESSILSAKSGKKDTAYILYPKFGRITLKQYSLISKYPRKIWQFSKTPKTEAEILERNAEYYQKHYSEDIKKLREFIKDTKYEVLNLSDEELMDHWGSACYMRRSDSKYEPFDPENNKWHKCRLEERLDDALWWYEEFKKLDEERAAKE